jgi:hypothetical protein
MDITLSHYRSLEAHLWHSVVQSGAEVQPVFRLYRNHDTGYRTLVERPVPRLLSLNSHQIYSLSIILGKQDVKAQFMLLCSLKTGT